MKDRRGYGRDARQFVRAGQRFGRLTVINPEVRKIFPSQPRGQRAALCGCDCGGELVTALTLLLRGGARSCGCVRGEKLGALARSHGLHGHPLYAVHHGMMQRCYRADHPAFHRYGGRGITVCERWHDLRLFITDIERILGPRPEGMTLDRWPDNDGHYELGNVRWATPSEQRRNQGARS